MHNSGVKLYIFDQTAEICLCWAAKNVHPTASIVQMAAKPAAHCPLTHHIPSQKFYKKTLGELRNLCDDSLEFNKCKGGDLVSNKIFESGFGTAWEVAR
jgi:hypothetical protein